MKRLFTIGVTALLAGTLAACSTGSPASDSTPQLPPAAAASVSASESAEAAAEAAQQKVADADAQKRVDVIEARLKTMSSLQAKLDLIVTEYCHAYMGTTMVVGADESTETLLEQLYVKTWGAGAYWDTPLQSAAMQQGGCPDVLKSAAAARD